MQRPGYRPTYVLDFEQPIVEIEKQIDALAELPNAERFDAEIRKLEETRKGILREDLRIAVGVANRARCPPSAPAADL